MAAPSAVRQAIAEAADYVALVTRTSPRGSADALLRRPDVEAVLREALDEARQAAAGEVAARWDAAGAGAGHETLAHLLSDVDRVFGSLPHLTGLVRRAHASVPQREFTRGVTLPGENPSQRAAEERSAAVRDALTSWARGAALRARMSADSAAGTGAAEAVLADALEREAAGESLRKRWRAHPEETGCCHWCRKLNGVTVGLRESFAPYLGGPVQLPHQVTRHVATRAGERRYGLGEGEPILCTHPPRPYRGRLQGPLLHPFCRCRLEIVSGPGSLVTSGHGENQALAGYVTAASVRAMPEEEYQASRAFIEAAAHELDQVLKRLAGGSG